MKKILADEGGFFTLIEAVITLMLVALLLLLPTIHSKPVAKGMTTQLFIEELKSDITLIHQNAVLNSQMTAVEFDPGKFQVKCTVVGDQASPLNKVLDMPEGMVMLGGYKRFVFKPYSGNISKADRIRFNHKGSVFELVFQVGSGRFYVREL